MSVSGDDNVSAILVDVTTQRKKELISFRVRSVFTVRLVGCQRMREVLVYFIGDSMRRDAKNVITTIKYFERSHYLSAAPISYFVMFPPAGSTFMSCITYPVCLFLSHVLIDLFPVSDSF